MGAISGWVLSIVGIIVITVIVELTMPEGNINKFIKGILVIFTVFIMISPITNIDVNSLFGDHKYSIELDDDFLNDINNQKVSEYENIILKKLKENGYENVKIEIVISSSNELKIESIFVDLCNLVLKQNDKNINIYNNIKSIIKSVVTIDAEDIIFYE